MNTNRLRGLLLGLLALALATPAAAKLRVVASTTDLGSIAASFGSSAIVDAHREISSMRLHKDMEEIALLANAVMLNREALQQGAVRA